jgi:RNA polymerase sigma-70 factor, ECF subfamily
VIEDEASLVEKAQKGDRRALTVLLRRYETSLYSSALAILSSSWDAHDAVQETMLEACSKLGSLRDAAKFRQWLTTIMVHKCYDRFREKKGVVLVDEPPEISAHVFVGDQRDDRLLGALRGLNEDQRLVLALRFFLDLRYDEVAAATGWPLGTVKSRINRGLEHLRRVLATAMTE